MASSFDYFEKEFPVLTKLGKLAESYCETDPNGALYKIRKIGESITALIYQNVENRTKMPADLSAFIKNENIYNAFVMPAENLSPENIGYVSADYVLPQNSEETSKSYYKIYGILMDVKSIMYNHIPKDKKLIEELANLISK